MNIFYRLKLALMSFALEKDKKGPFDSAALDMWKLPEDAGNDINNSWWFGAYDLEGRSLTLRLGNRNNGMSEVFVMFSDHDGSFYVTEQQLFPQDNAPLRVKNLIPGRDWRVEFEGELTEQYTGKRVAASFAFDYTARLPIFYPVKDDDSYPMAKAFARMKWNRKFFRQLSQSGVGKDGKTYKQVHVEQTGFFKGSMNINGKTISLDMKGARDRAYGKRDWDFMSQHVWIIAATEKGEVLNFSLVSYPHVHNLNVGYMDFGCDRNYSIHDYKMIHWDHNDGKGPDEMVVDMSFTNGMKYRMKCRKQHDLFTPFDGGKFYFHECVGPIEFTRINELGQKECGPSEIKAYGTIEYGWNRDRSRWNEW